jgi:hypothetical protein
MPRTGVTGALRRAKMLAKNKVEQEIVMIRDDTVDRHQSKAQLKKKLGAVQQRLLGDNFK